MNHFFFKILAVLILCWAAPALATDHCLQEKFSEAQAGDFIVTAQSGNYSLLSIRSITQETLILEEISTPGSLIDLKKINWKKWVKEKAPGHTSWTLFEIDRLSGKLIECFSCSKNGWLYLDDSEQFITRLLTLPLSPVLDSDRKKIGPPPSQGEPDRRSSWNPPLIIEGKKVDKPKFEILKTQWPNDNSRLALCDIELYFAKELPSFPFPYWLEVHSPHYAFKMRAIDSGRGLVSPITGSMPHRSPQILGSSQKRTDHWTLAIRAPLYFQNLHLFAIDLTSECKATIPVPFHSKSNEMSEERTLEIKTSDLKCILTSGNRYQWILIPEGSSAFSIESEETFTWNDTSSQK